MFWLSPLTWIELAFGICLLGAVVLYPLREPTRSWGWGLAVNGLALAAALVGAMLFFVQHASDSVAQASLIMGERSGFAVDELNAPLFVVVTLLHFLTALATGRTKMRRYALEWSLISEAIRLATFACHSPRILLALLFADIIPAYVELLNRRKPTRVYLLHMLTFMGLLLLGWLLGPQPGGPYGTWGAIACLAAILIRSGVVPFHCWLTDWFEHSSFGTALLFVTPLTGMYAAVRITLPNAPDWMLNQIEWISLVTALYAACMALVQHETRRFFAYIFLSHASLVLLGLQLHTVVSLTGALAQWVSVALALGGFGLTLRAIESRFGLLSLDSFHGLYESTPSLALCFLLTGLGSIGFPGTLGFVAADLVVDGALGVNPFVGVCVALAAAINGIAVLRAYFALFTGTRHQSTVPLGSFPRERYAVLTLAALILGGGLFPQIGVQSRYRAAQAILTLRSQNLQQPLPTHGGHADGHAAESSPSASPSHDAH